MPAPRHPGILRHSSSWGPSFIRHAGCRTDHAGGKTQGEAVLSPDPTQSSADMTWGTQITGSRPLDSPLFESPHLQDEGLCGYLSSPCPAPLELKLLLSPVCGAGLNSTRPILEPGRSQLDPAHVLFFSFCIKKESLLLRGKIPRRKRKKSVCGHCGNHG